MNLSPADPVSLDRLQQLLGYQFTDPALLRQALTHRSAASVNNERLEFLGDAILGFRIAERLYQGHDDADEGSLSRMRAQLVKKETLAQVGKELNLGDWLQLGPGELRTGGHRRASTLADAVEAIIAAAYLDGGIAPANALIDRLLDSRLGMVSPQRQGKDAKTRLQEWLQARRYALPEYEVIEVTGEAHAQCFRVACLLPDLQLRGEGRGSSRRKAEQQAAEQLLSQLGESAA
jgi:ribonuclease-3